MEEKDLKKEAAKLKREATEIASEIHDIVEDTIWTDYPRMKELSEELIKRCDKYTAFKKENGL